MSTVSFPNLGIEFTINRVMFSIGGFPVYWYGVLIAFGMMLGIWFATKNATRFGLNEDRMMDVILGGAVISVLGGRAFYILFEDTFTIASLKEFFNLRSGGMAFYGALIAAVVGAAVLCRVRKVRFLPLMDIAGIGFLIGQGIGRWGNFFNQELFGVNTDLPWGMYSDTIARYIARESARLYEAHGIVLADGPVHPTFFYESIWCLLGAVLLIRIIDKRRFDGELFCKFMIWNGIGRAFTESLRTDALFLGRIRISQFVCFLLIAVGSIALIAVRSRIRREGDDEYLKPYGMTEAFALEAASWKKAEGGAAEESTEEPAEEAAEADDSAPAEEAAVSEENETEQQ
ncbi:MAG: prolipoprotein diacylglyceryl transferase [Oscillospiraceae bacterium]|nr:prolipoprotein diacylglyceryl transferase [Oscillospiraceae bacterium]